MALALDARTPLVLNLGIIRTFVLLEVAGQKRPVLRTITQASDQEKAFHIATSESNCR